MKCGLFSAQPLNLTVGRFVQMNLALWPSTSHFGDECIMKTGSGSIRPCLEQLTQCVSCQISCFMGGWSTRVSQDKVLLTQRSISDPFLIQIN